MHCPLRHANCVGSQPDSGDAVVVVVGVVVGIVVGCDVKEGALVGAAEGGDVGSAVGAAEGVDDDPAVGSAVGVDVGEQKPEVQLQRIAPGTNTELGHPQSSNASGSMVAPLARTAVVRLEFSLNARLSMAVTDGSVIEVRRLRINACTPIVVTESGKVRVCRPQLVQKLSGIVAIESGIWIEVRLNDCMNAASPRNVTESGIRNDVKPVLLNV